MLDIKQAVIGPESKFGEATRQMVKADIERITWVGMVYRQEAIVNTDTTIRIDRPIESETEDIFDRLKGGLIVNSLKSDCFCWMAFWNRK